MLDNIVVLTLTQTASLKLWLRIWCAKKDVKCYENGNIGTENTGTLLLLCTPSGRDERLTWLGEGGAGRASPFLLNTVLIWHLEPQFHDFRSNLASSSITNAFSLIVCIKSPLSCLGVSEWSNFVDSSGTPASKPPTVCGLSLIQHFTRLKPTARRLFFRALASRHARTHKAK